ncbi:MAG: hypothetical protein QSU88_04860, partial [Candidatus Methanoperedens sp.]|nr:hypothetical protein [Candidatus Methanoperedens sp.]
MNNPDINREYNIQMNTKFTLLSLMILLAAGCVTKEDNNMEKISISADGFKEGGTIPEEFTCEGKDISPALSWEGIPA